MSSRVIRKTPSHISKARFRAGRCPIASIYSTGRCDLFVSLGEGVSPLSATLPASTPVYLGTCEVAPEPEFRDSWEPVMSDIAGRKNPLDRIYQGTECVVQCDLNRFNYTAVQLLKARTSKLPGGPGYESPIARGSFLVTNKLSFMLWCRFAFAGTVNAADYALGGGALPSGYFWPCCAVMGRFPEVIGTDTHKVRLIIQAHPWWDSVSQDFVTYYQDAAYFASLPAIT